MPFLGFGNYSKPGPGVRKDEEEQSVWLKFFVIFKRRLSKFMQLNLIYMIPFAIVLAMMFGVAIMPGMRYALQINMYTLNLWNLYVVPAPLILLAPFWGGVMVVSRRLANEEYAFIWSEYWKGVKENWKQFLLNGIFIYVMYVLLSFSFLYYSANFSQGILFYIGYAMIILIAVLFLFSQYYVSVMVVSVNLKLFHIYKNALILALMGLGRNLLLTLTIVLALAVLVGLVIAFTPLLVVSLLLIALLLFSFIAYATSYLAYPMVQRFIIAPYENKDIIKEDFVDLQGDALMYHRDELDDGEETEKAPQYIYVDGKLVKRDPDGEEEDEQIFRDRT